MILLVVFSISAIILLFFVVCKFAFPSSGENISYLSDANYLLNKDIDTSREKDLQLHHSLQEWKESISHLQVERDHLPGKQKERLYEQIEKLKKQAGEESN
jgi:F0F1-type ATP synthase membrane subunit b/b'